MTNTFITIQQLALNGLTGEIEPGTSPDKELEEMITQVKEATKISHLSENLKWLYEGNLEQFLDDLNTLE